MSARNVMEDFTVPEKVVAPTKLLLTISEATEVLAISRSKVYELLNSGHLPSVHIGRSRRIRVRDVEDFVNCGGSEY
jgi:excisionase family DNA binding protein